MECTIKWVDGMSFIAETGTGHLVAMDGAPEAGGRNLAPRPMELMLAGAGGCTAFDIVLILKRGRHDVRGCSVRLEAERADTPEGVYTNPFRLHGDWTQLEARSRRARNSPVCGKVLFSINHAGQDGRDQPRVRNRGSRLKAEDGGRGSAPAAAPPRGRSSDTLAQTR